MGSIPILTETPPLSSSVGRALQHKAHLAKYCGMEQSVARLAHYQKVIGSNPIPAPRYCAGGAKAAHLAHYQETTFESFVRNQPRIQKLGLWTQAR